VARRDDIERIRNGLTAAAEAVRPFTPGDIAFERKDARGDPVTAADHAADAVLRDLLPRSGEGWLSEESVDDASRLSCARVWVVDPIDGTICYSRGIPLFSTLIALVSDGQPVVGLIDLPALDERYLGFAGGGCERNGSPVQVSQAKEIEQAIISHGDPFCFDRAGQRAAFDRMAREIPMLRGYTDAFGHAQVLGGGVDAMVDFDLNPWDAAATEILVREADGDCRRLRQANGKIGLVLGSPALVEQLSSFLA
jgi:inositol-phosphate phosphatase/L-galactose 1-phosphate phosphatase/histidinol-phosphatase